MHRSAAILSASLALSSALMVAPLAPKLEGRHLASLIMQHDGKGFGGGEARRQFSSAVTSLAIQFGASS